MKEKRGVIVLGGDPLDEFFFKKDDFIIACDFGFEFLKKNGVKADVVLGDFDSLGYIPENARVFSCDKDYTDGELGLICAAKEGLKHVDLICAGGGRDDHFYANIGLLEKAYQLGVNATVHTKYGKIIYCKKEFSVSGVLNKTISVYPLENAVIESSIGLKYEYSNTELFRGSSLGVSNLAILDRVEIKVSQGAVLIFINN